MPWCPKCKNEYYEGIKVCADCGEELVDSLEEWEEAEREAREAERQAQIAAIKEMMQEEANDDDAGDFLKDAEGEAEKPGSPENGDSEAAGMRTEEKKRAEEISRGVYQNYEEKAADNKSSAYSLLIIGAAGAVVILLALFDVISLPLNSSTKYVTLGMMEAMFVFFVVMGVVSMKNAGKYAKKAESEKELTKELEKWFVEYVTAEKIDDDLFTEEEADFSEEQKYFKRFDRMKELLSERFLNLNEGYVDRFLDKHYQDIFGDGK